MVVKVLGCPVASGFAHFPRADARLGILLMNVCNNPMAGWCATLFRVHSKIDAAMALGMGDGDGKVKGAQVSVAGPLKFFDA